MPEANPGFHPARITVAGPTSMLDLLDQLVDGLARIQDSAATPTRPDPATHHWEDNDHVYLEFRLPGCPNLEADISFHEGRAFICLVR